MSNPIILMETSSGDILLELFEDKAPVSAANFLKYVDEEFYQNTMARTADPHSASAQFFINTVDNPDLDYQSDADEEYGYCVFGQVIEGMDVVDKIQKLKTKPQGEHDDAPVDMVVITGMSRFE